MTLEGKIEAVFGYEEFGQGLIATMEQMLIEQFGLAAEDLSIVIGDTDVVPDSGSSTASRSTSMMWMALKRLRPDFTARVLQAAAMIKPELDNYEMKLGPGGIWLKDGGLLRLTRTWHSVFQNPLSVIQSLLIQPHPLKEWGHISYTPILQSQSAWKLICLLDVSVYWTNIMR